MTLLEIAGLSAHTHTPGRALLDDVSLWVSPGRILAVVGSSGAGKTTLGLAALGQAHRGIRLTGAVRLAGADLLGMTASGLRAARVGVVGHLPQHPGAVLDPARRCGPVLVELAGLRHRGRAARRAAARDALHRAGLAEAHWRRFPHQLSGGQQQRMALATTLATEPRLLVLDEPTTGLDPAARDSLANHLRALAAGGTGLLVLTHDLALVRATADDIAVLDHGTIIEAGTARGVLVAPSHPHTRTLLAVHARPPAPRLHARTPTLLTVRDLGVRARLLEGVDLDLPAASRTALIGASGAGKTTLARAVAGLLAPTTGTITLDGTALPGHVRRRSRAQLRAIQYVHQDARASFDEFRPVPGQVAATATRLRGLDRADARAELAPLLDALGLPDDARRPDQLSGGQLRRYALARALLARPRLLICDEVTTGLDTVSQRRVLHLLDYTATHTGVALLMIGHDHPAIATITDRTAVLDSGRLLRVTRGGCGAAGRCP